MVKLDLQYFGGRGASAGPSNSVSSDDISASAGVPNSISSGNDTNAKLQLYRQTGAGEYEKSGEANIELTPQSAQESASEWFDSLDKGTARMQAETWAYKDGEGFMSYDAERNTVQSMFNKQNDTTRQRIYPKSYEESFTSKQMDALHSGIKEAALNYIEKDKQTKAGAKYWSKRG